METPSLFQKKPAVLGDGLIARQDMVECRRVDALWMAALRRLIELLRVAKQDNGLGRLRHGQNVRKGHLGRLVDEEHVDRIEGVGTSPKPSRPARHLAIAMKS